MDALIVTVILYIIEALIFWRYCAHIFSSRYGIWRTLICIGIDYGILLLIFLHKNLGLNILTFFIGNAVLILFLFKPRWYVSLFHAGILTVLMLLSEIIVANLITNRLYTYYDHYSYNLLIIGLPNKLLYYIFTLFVVRLFHPAKDQFFRKDKTALILCLIPFMSVGIIYTMISICLHTSISDRLDHMITVSTFFLLAINILVFGIYDHNQKKNRQFTDMQLQLQRESDSAQYYKAFLAQDENQQILIHDIKKHLNTIALLNENGERERIGAYIDQIIRSDDLKESVRICDNDLLNAILNHYKQRCEQIGVEMRLDIRSSVLDFMEDNDLAAMFYNLLDNAMEAAQKQDGSFIELSAAARKNTPFTVVTMTNSCRTDPFSGQDGKLVSGKQDTIRHGFGVKSMEKIAGKYNGDLQVYYHKESKTFHTIITLKNR